MLQQKYLPAEPRTGYRKRSLKTALSARTAQVNHCRTPQQSRNRRRGGDARRVSSTPLMQMFQQFARVSWMLLLLCLPAAAGAAHLDVAVGKPFPDLEFASLLDPQDYAKLGLDRTAGPVRLSDVPGRFLAIEFFNKSCRPCQRQVREMESFYQELLAEGGGTPPVRVLAVAVGNQARYLPAYREKRNLTYPIAADAEFEQWRRLGEPGRTPFIVFLRREPEGWVLNSFHFGIHERESLAEQARGLRDPRVARGAADVVSPLRDAHEAMPFSADELRTLAGDALGRVAGRELQVEEVDLGKRGVVYQTRLPLSGRRLYARAVTRAPVCEVCHAVHFLFVFDDTGQVLGFEPVHVTKYGNVVWSPEEVETFARHLQGRRLQGLAFDPEVDAVTSATMTSALIYDEVRRTAVLLEELANR